MHDTLPLHSLGKNEATNCKKIASSPVELAKMGFCRIDIDTVKCVFCNIKISDTDDAFDAHCCPTQRNLPALVRFLPGQDICGFGDLFPSSVSNDDYEVRLKSFESWPESSKQKPEFLAEAGWYYKGEGDKTVCFECSGTLNNWQDEDDPWEQHALWYPHCKFVLEKKGKEFIEDVHKRLKTTIFTDSTKDVNETDDEKLCIVCCNNRKEVIFWPCGHNWLCLNCTNLLEEKKCPVCRKQIVRTQRNCF